MATEVIKTHARYSAIHSNMEELFDEDLDEPTQPFTHTQIGRMLNAAEGDARGFNVDISLFDHFGESGTPAGMIGSRDCALAVGWCGDPPAPRPTRRAPPPVADDDYPWGPAPSELSEAPASPCATTSPPTSTPPEPAVGGGVTPDPLDLIEPLDTDLVGAGLGGRRRLLAFLASIVLAGATGGWVWSLLAPTPEADDVAEVESEILVLEPVEIEPDTSDKFAHQRSPAEEVREAPGEERDEDESQAETTTKEPRWQSSRCANKRASAERAKKSGQWKQLEKLGRGLHCWEDPNDARALRMEALFELDRIDKCLGIGKHGKGPKVERWKKLCSSRRR